jgi:hypothetical protein
VRAALRAALGCEHGRLLQLTAAERARCEETLGKGVDPNVAWPAPIAPEKRAWFDAAVAAHNSPGHPPLLVCSPALFGKHKPSGLPHALKLGPLPCAIDPPQGAFTEEVDVAPPSRQQPDK